MELRARNTSRTAPRKGRGMAAPPAATPRAAAEGPASSEGPHCSITVRYDTLLYYTLQNMVRSAHTAQDFTYASPADFIRAALRAYKDGIALTELDQGGAKLETSLRVDRDLWLFYKSLPGRMRSKILERVIRTFLKQQLETAGKPAGHSQGRSRKRQTAG
jgi:hypothetical protein